MSTQGRRLANGLGLAVAALAYLIAVGLAATQLTFYWDDHFFILTEMDRGLGGALLTGINGHWWPVATLMLFVQTRTFGFWYPGYLLTNAVIVLWITWLAWRILAPLVTRGRWLLLAVLAVFATSFGVLVNISVITTSWPLSVAFAMLGALLVARDRPTWTWLLAFGLSFLSGSGLFFVNMVAASALFVVALSGGAAGGWTFRKRDIGRAMAVIAAGALGTMAGYLLTGREPIDYYAASPSVLEPASSVDIVAIGQSVVANSVAWGVSPVLPGSLVLPKAMPWLMILVATYLTAVLVAIVVAVVFAWYGMRHRGPQWLAPLRPRVPALLILLAPVVTTAVVLTAVRSGSVFAPRFWLLWLVPTGAMWFVLLTTDARTLVHRIGMTALRVLLVASAVAGVLAVPWSMRNAADVDKARWASTDQQLVQAARCVAGLPVVPVAEIAPAVTAENYCRIVLHLRQVSMTGRLFGYPQAGT